MRETLRAENHCDIIQVMIEIDGSYGEGGGQILRTALGLSCLFRKPFRIYNIRKERSKPGLMPQHLTGVRAAQLLSGADVRGDEPGSTELFFSPREVRAGEFLFDTGTAGSTMLVLQTILPALLLGQEKSVAVLKGGTHVPFSPSYHYIEEVFRPALKATGMDISLSIESYGFYPKGGGRIRAEISPCRQVNPLSVTARGGLVKITGYSGVGNLPVSIAERQKNSLVGKVRSAADLRCPVEIRTLSVPTPGQGTFLDLCAQSEYATAGFTSLGERGKRAEQVGEDAGAQFIDYYSTDAALDPHLADQIVLYLSLADGESVFTASRITRHLTTNLWAISRFHDFSYTLEGDIGKPGRIRIDGRNIQHDRKL